MRKLPHRSLWNFSLNSPASEILPLRGKITASRSRFALTSFLAVVLMSGLILVAVQNERATEEPASAAESDPVPAAATYSTENTISPSPSTTEGEPIHLVGEVNAQRIVARAGPGEEFEKIASFEKFNDQGAPQVFLLEPHETDAQGLLPEDSSWVKALLPLRPNGTTGYLAVEDLVVRHTPYRLVVDTAAFRLKVFEGDSLIMKVPVGIGTGRTPTPIGDFFLASLLEPPDPSTVYGTYAYGLSGYSETLLDWKGGGVIGLHGTNDPSSIGNAVSHGCIRMRNRDIEKLVPLLPLGTPIKIT